MRLTASGVLLASSMFAVATLAPAPAAAWDSGYYGSGYGYGYAPRYSGYCDRGYGYRSRYSGYGGYGGGYYRARRYDCKSCGAPYRYRYRYSDGYDYGYDRPYRGYRVRSYGW